MRKLFNKGMLNESLNPLWTYYNNCYEGIRAANFFLDYVADGKGIALLEKNRNLITDAASYARDVRSLNFYIAEAHVARAYYYAELIKMYGGVPIVEKTQQQSGGAFVERSSYEACVEYIVSEIDNWKDQLALNWNDDNTREGRFTLGAALAIKARVLLYAASPLHNPAGDRAKWVRAAEAAKDILVNPDLGYTLAGDYGSYFQGSNSLSSKETIYVVRRAANNTMETNNYPIATSGGKSGVCPTENLVSAYEYIGTPDPENPYANRDPRLAASIVTNGSSWNGRVIAQAAGETDDQARANASRTGYYLKKFLTDGLNLTQGQTAQHNWVAYRWMFRDADLILNGGSKDARYNINLDYLGSEGILGTRNTDQTKNLGYNRFNVRANLDFNVLKIFEVRFDMGGRIEMLHRPNYAVSSLFGNLAKYPSNVYDIFDDAMKEHLSGTAVFPNNPGLQGLRPETALHGQQGRLLLPAQRLHHPVLQERGQRLEVAV